MKVPYIVSPEESAKKLSAKELEKGYEFQSLHHYLDDQGEIVYWRIRLKRQDGEKWIRPMYVDENGSYHLGEPSTLSHAHKPLYGLYLLQRNLEAAVVVVEGEYCADELNMFFRQQGAASEYIAITSGSATSVDQAEWRPLMKRKIIIWPDYDDPGKNYAEKVARKLMQWCCDIQVIDSPAIPLKGGEDCVDWLVDNPEATVEQMLKLPMVQWDGAANEEFNFLPVLLHRSAAEVKIRPIDWLWPDRFARGKFSLIAGNPGLGKSQIIASMAAIITQGTAWPDGTSCNRGLVVILSAEDDAADTIVPRLKAAGAVLEDVQIIEAVQHGSQDNRTTVPFNLASDIDSLDLLLEKLGNVSALFIDPISAYLGQIDDHKNSNVRALLMPLAALAEKHNVAIICISHLNKGGSPEALLRVAGSIGYVAASRAAFIVVKDDSDENARLFLPLKNNLGNDETGLSFKIDSCEIADDISTSYVVWSKNVIDRSANEAVTSAAGGRDRSAREEAKEFLLEMLQNGPALANEIKAQADQEGISAATLRRAKSILK